MADPETTNEGIFKSLKRIGGVLVSVLRNRVELFAIELQEEKHRQLELLFLTGSALVLGLLGLGLISGAIVFLFPESARLLAAGGLGVLYLCVMAWLLYRVKKRLPNQPFSETINQLKKDVECLTPPK